MRYEKVRVFMKMAAEISRLSTCSRRSVGCLLLDQNQRIIGSGYNGVPRNVTHCINVGCPYEHDPHGSSCLAVHAEQNAIAQCCDPLLVHYVFTTSFPCFECAKQIMNTGARQVYYRDSYPSSEDKVHDLMASCVRFDRVVLNSATELL